ncbi:HET-domain-containing protein [Ophiobolus disseminans]|uniref:HET-domain-containing protein n=1 Tax=Ophiobolus disseminans TaxID=1469910 RepID=A0A6A7AC04_9PLEO|nr:HET-domain-containing protein [Ophiobolus disseminans]
MHLLQRQGDSSFRHVVFRDNRHIPPYAILSHTWGPEEDEVSFQDLTNRTGTTKAGYRKIDFCAKQAARDKLQFFWIDTCCIDKSSSAELAEAINSMFRWYRDSAKCYVYLDDVSADSMAKNELAFQKSRWFTRGWTLQELLAPKSVEFFSREGDRLGSKSSRMQEIADITGIPTEALQESVLSSFSVDQRMIWANGRETTREEDMVYSLLGIFNIYLPLLYGEGRENALRRLQKKIMKAQEPVRSYTGDDERQDEALRSDHFEFVLQTQTMLHETNDHFSFLMGDSEDTNPPDLIAVNRSGTSDENIEVNVLYGSSNYQNFILRIATPNFTPLRKHWADQLEFTLADWNGDGTLDLIVIKKFDTGTHRTEVHIFSGASKFQEVLLQTGTKLEETDNTWSFGMGKWGDGDRPDLFAIKKSNTGTKSTEVHILYGDSNFQDFILQTGTGLHETDSKFDFIVTDWNGDGRPDLVAVKKSETSVKRTEVHVLSGGSGFKEFILQTETPLFRSNGLCEFAVADWTCDGKPDLIAFKKSQTGTNSTEIHVMSQ